MTKRRNAVTIATAEGFPLAIDVLAASGPPELGFLRRAWFAAGGESQAQTLTAVRADGTPIAAIPSRPAGPAMLRARAVPGGYWPFRGVPIAADASDEELHALLSDNALNPCWRLGPVYRDAGTLRLRRIARRAGWTILTRRSGRSWVLDITALQAEGPWPRASTLKKNRAHLRKLEAEGAVAWRSVRGADWAQDVFDALAAIEAASWIATTTDGSGAKFLKPEQRAIWENAARDPVLAEMLSATLLTVGGRPAAFSLDLTCGALQYGIASSYDEAFARFRAGRLLAWKQIEDAIAAGVARIDWGAGDSGYKREAGAVPGPLIEDHLFVRSAALAAVLRPGWERSFTRSAKEPDAEWEAERDPLANLPQILMAGMVAAAAAALGE